MHFLRPVLAGAVLVAIPLAASAAKTFVAPATWTHVVTGTPGAARTVDVWKLNDSPTSPVLNVVVDTTQSYADALAGVRAYAQNDGIKVNRDKDKPCAGVTAHEFEIDVAGSNPTLSIYTIIPNDPKGITRITYSRPADARPSKDVQAAVDAFCAPATTP